MKLEELLEFANQNPQTWFATTQGDQPRVRGMLMWYADQTGFYYHTGTMKRLSKQIQENPKVELAFTNNSEDPGESMMVRVTGEIQILEDTKLQEKLYKDRPWLLGIKDQFPDSKILIMRLQKGEATYWNMANNGRESQQEPLKFNLSQE